MCLDSSGIGVARELWGGCGQTVVKWVWPDNCGVYMPRYYIFSYPMMMSYFKGTTWAVNLLLPEILGGST